MKKAFTIIELLVAMALLVILVAISGVVFSAAVKAHRTAAATTEIMARMRAVTEQLDMDFRGLRNDMPVAIWYEYDPVTRKRYDQIQFFANGVFQTSRQWTYYKKTDATSATTALEGNTARIYYGQANNVSIDLLEKKRTATRSYKGTVPDARSLGTQQILARRCHLMTQLQMPEGNVFPTASMFTASFVAWKDKTLYGNDVFEYDNLSLADWRMILDTAANASHYILTCFNNRPGVDLSAADGQSLHMILSQGVGSFAVQRAKWDSAASTYKWYPEATDFGASNQEGEFYYSKADSAYKSAFQSSTSGWSHFKEGFTGVRALKFTFTIYDSKGVFPDGKTFTHIVYLNN